MNTNIVNIINSIIAPKDFIDEFCGKYNVICRVKDVYDCIKCVYMACRGGFLKLIKILLKRIERDGFECENFTMLIYAVKENRTNVAKYLYKEGSRVDEFLADAIFEKNNKELIDLMFKERPFRQGISGACLYGDMEIIKQFDKSCLIHGAYSAATKNNVELIKYIKNAYYDDILCGAAYGGHMDLVKSSIKCTKQFNEAFSCAAENGHVDIMKYLHENGAKATKSSMYNAVSSQNKEAIEYMLELKPNFIEECVSYLCELGNLELIEHFSKRSAKNWNLYITYAITIETIEYLRNKGAVLDLNKLRYRENLDLIRYYLSKGFTLRHRRLIVCSNPYFINYLTELNKIVV